MKRRMQRIAISFLCALLAFPLGNAHAAGALERCLQDVLQAISSLQPQQPTAAPTVTPTERPAKKTPAWQSSTPPQAVTDLLNLWQQHDIYIDLPAPSFATLNERSRYEIANRFTLLYDAQTDEKDWFFFLELPGGYAPMRDAHALAISYYCKINETEAYKLYDSLVYNTIGSEASRDVGTFTVKLTSLRDGARILTIAPQ